MKPQHIRATDLLAAGLWINGQECLAEDGRTFPVTNPASGEILQQVPLAGEREASRAVSAASRAFRGWKSKSPAHRADILWNIRDLLLEHRGFLAELRTLEQGAPLAQGRAEVDYAAGFFKWFAEEAPRIYGRTVSHRDPQRHLRVEYYPVGVVGAITPWNGPLATPAKKIAAVLAAGCTVVLKPAELTPLSAFALARLSKKAGLPDGVLNVVCGDAPAIGRVLLDHREVRMIAFTGSTRTGKYLMSEAGKQIKRVTLELGGNAPFVVFGDADLDLAARDLDWLKFNNCGQVCVTANRVLVERSVHEQFVSKIMELLGRHRVGDGRDAETTIGPMICRDAVKKVASLVHEAVHDGATLVCGGQRSTGRGECFYPPTLLINVKPTMRIANEEIFGPVVCVYPFDDEEEALELSNDTPYGLAAYVYTRSAVRAQRFADGLEVGVVGINDPRPITPEAPFGGVKQSGIGREGGTEGLLEYMDVRLIGTRFPR